MEVALPWMQSLCFEELLCPFMSSSIWQGGSSALSPLVTRSTVQGHTALAEELSPKGRLRAQCFYSRASEQQASSLAQ